jgi:preprotein translocase subunit SecG
MGKKTKITAILFTAFMAILLLSCGTGDETTDNSGIDYTSHNTSYSILVRNNTGERLIAFKGDLLDSKLIGGIPAHAQNHGLPNDPALFDKTEDFPMIILTEAQYNANKDNLSSLKNTPFTRVYVFFNRSGDNTIVYEIAAGLGGNNEFKIINASNSINVELRLNGAAGETIGYAPAGILETTLKLQDGNYNIFPVFKRYNTFRDVVETVYPQGSGSNYTWFESYSFGEGTTSATMNLKNLLQNTTFVLGAAWVYVNNQTSSGGIRFVEGSNVKETASGLTNIMSGNPRTFQIDMPKAGNNTYADSITVSNWKFGATGFEAGLQTGENDATPLASLEIQQGKMYTITVSGSHNDNSLKAWVSNTTDIPQNELSGTW